MPFRDEPDEIGVSKLSADVKVMDWSCLHCVTQLYRAINFKRLFQNHCQPHKWKAELVDYGYVYCWYVYYRYAFIVPVTGKTALVLLQPVSVKS